ncbi:MAG: M20/M25/M40 family metallo-hydrolase, partial [Acidobacteria bacterium]|nr:M20/M25/M40 family metallo-hydrolase [Acidobacteriota bacterium]
MVKENYLLLFLVLFLFSFPVLCGEPDFLIQVDKKDITDKDQFIDKNFNVVFETLNSLFFTGDKEDIEGLKKYGYLPQIIDLSPTFFKYYSVGMREDSDINLVKKAGEIIYSEENLLILRIPFDENLKNLYDARVFITPISLDGFKKPLYKEDAVQEKIRNRIELANPMVQKMVNSVNTANIDNTWNTIVTNSPTGTRYSTNTGCFDASNYVLGQFQNWGLQTRSLTHTSGHAPNIEGQITGQVTPTEIYLIEGHLDDMPESGTAPGADDNASGSVAVVEAARILSCWGFKKTVRFLTVTGEEQGLYGSKDYANDALSAGENIQGVLNFDMPGWQGDGSPNPENLDLNYDSQSQTLGQFVAQCATNYGTGLAVDAFLCPSLNASDHYQFWLNGYKAVCGITDNEGYCGHSGSYPYYHTVNDTIANCGNKNFFYSVIKTSVASLGELGDPFKITFNKTSYSCSSTVQIIVADRDLNTNSSTQQTVNVSVWSTVEGTPETVTLTEDGVNSMYFKGTITLTTNPPVNGDGYLSVGNGSTIYASYTDAVDCDGSTNVLYTANASACTPPVITNVAVSDVTASSAKITWTTNIPANSRVTYGT